jgi:EAL domain-containing protein (putative c-di-GMP-specific phosphodiesterase class I)
VAAWVSKRALDCFLTDPEVDIAFQPIYRLGSGQVLGFEALARFPEPGPRTPMPWIDAARRAGRTADLDRLLFCAAVEGFARSRLAGSVFVNVEAADLHLVDQWMRGLRTPEARHLRVGRGIVLEVTERRPDPAAGWRSAGRTTRGAGFVLSLDDFLCEPRFLKHARRLRPSYVKLDRTLVGALLDGPSREEGGDLARLERWMTALQGCGATLIAEGVQHEGHVLRLLARGIRYGQGFGLGRPAPAHAWTGTPSLSAV